MAVCCTGGIEALSTDNCFQGFHNRTIFTVIFYGRTSFRPRESTAMPQHLIFKEKEVVLQDCFEKNVQELASWLPCRVLEPIFA